MRMPDQQKEGRPGEKATSQTAGEDVDTSVSNTTDNRSEYEYLRWCMAWKPIPLDPFGQPMKIRWLP
jgi:hypothetical protein